MNYESLIDRLMQFYTGDPFAREVRQAKEEFIRDAGAFDELAPDFETKMAQFSDWFLFTRPLLTTNKPPVSDALTVRPSPVSDAELALVNNLAHHRHSLFEVVKINTTGLVVKDLFSAYRHEVKNLPTVVGFDKGVIFEARLIPHDDFFVFASSFCFHPPGVNKFILSEVKKIKAMEATEQAVGRAALISRLFRMRYKHEQYRHVPLDQIYTNNSKLKL